MATPTEVKQAEETREMFDTVNDELTRNLQAYMDSLPKLAQRFSKFLENTKTLNPKSSKRHPTEQPLSPLLKCRGVEPKAVNGGNEGKARLPALDLNDTCESAEDLLEEAARNTPRDNHKSLEQFLEGLAGISTADALPALPEDPLLLTNMDALTCETYELRIVLSGVCEWIEMQMPAIKLEDNSGVAIQETVIRHLGHMRNGIHTINVRHRTYRDKVADYASKYYKHPNAAKQWAQALILWNNDHWDQLERDWRELRQVVILSGRLLALNMERLATPRKSSHFMHM